MHYIFGGTTHKSIIMYSNYKTPFVSNLT